MTSSSTSSSKPLHPHVSASLPLLLRKRESFGPNYARVDPLKQRNPNASCPDGHIHKQSQSTNTKQTSEDGVKHSYNLTNFRSSATSSIAWITKLQLKKRLYQHRGCVNTIQWNREGDLLVTGSDDRQLSIWSGEDYHLIQSLSTGHTRNIFCAHFVPGDNSKIVSCAMDGEVRLSYAREGVGTKVGSDGKMRGSVSGLEDVRGAVGVGSATPTDLLYSGYHMSFKLAFLPFNPSVFLSTHQDGSVRLFDLRCKQRADGRSGTVIVDLESAHYMGGRNSSGLNPNALAMDRRTGNKFIIGCSDPVLRMHDIRFSTRKGGSADEFRLDKPKRSRMLQQYAPRADINKSFRNCYVTGVDYNEAGEIVATYSRENVYLFEENPPLSYSRSQPADDHHISSSSSTTSEKETNKSKPIVSIRQFSGHRNTQTFLKEIRFMGNNNFIATGSDCGHMYIWEKHSGELVQVLKADENVVNGIAPHPFLPFVAACGIDSDGKIFEVGHKRNVNKQLMKNDDDNNDDDNDESSSFLHLWSFLAALRDSSRGERGNAYDDSDSDDQVRENIRAEDNDESDGDGGDEDERRERREKREREQERLNSGARLLRIILGRGEEHILRPNTNTTATTAISATTTTTATVTTTTTTTATTATTATSTTTTTITTATATTTNTTSFLK